MAYDFALALSVRYGIIVLRLVQYALGKLLRNSMGKTVITTTGAPGAIGTYSQAVRCGDTVYISGQIGLDPATMQMVEGIEAQIHRVFSNLKAIAEAAGSTLEEVVRVTIYLTDLAHFAKVNEIMATYFPQPYPARAAVGVSSLPRGALVEADAVLVIGA
jgi:reactive intermediate/imine deaminase